jgi:hypothetical protein
LRRFLRFTTALWFALALPLLAMRLRPYANPFFDSLGTPDCAMPCILGIHPTVSTLDEALDMLRTNSRVDTASLQVIRLVNDPNEQSILWHWLPGEEDGFDYAAPSFITLRRGLVTRIDLSVQLQLTDVLAFAGQPPRMFNIRRLEGTEVGWYYPDTGAFYLSNLDCERPQQAMVFALQIRLVRSPEPFTDFARWHGLQNWYRAVCK